MHSLIPSRFSSYVVYLSFFLLKVFKENPGGEFRKSYHGYPSGYAQLIHSPSNWIVEPMQIDTHNRNYSITDPVGYQASFMPQIFLNNMTNLNSGLSPLIECPCSDRITKSQGIQIAVISLPTGLPHKILSCTANFTILMECLAK